jgi:predicted alpha/beta-hydrolase family hydrolase
MKPETFTVPVAADAEVTARLYSAKRAASTLILAHGAGGGQGSSFMIDIATHLSQRDVAVVSFDFLYMERGKRAPDRPDVLLATWRAVLAAVRARVPGPLFAGGKSMGGRILSMVAAEPDFDATVSGLVFLGFPMHPPGKPAQLRTAHLARIKCPMLFVQGSRDPFGTEEEIRPLVKRLARRKQRPTPALYVVTGGDHSFKVPKKGHPPQADVARGIEDTVVRFTAGQPARAVTA